MLQCKRTQTRFRHGLTLMELVVVMAVLVAMAGILIPLFPGLIARSSSAAGAANLEEIVKAVQLYGSQNNDMYGDYSDTTHGYDSLVNAAGAICTYVPQYAYGTSPLSAANLASGDVSALSRVGISYAAPMIEKPTDTVGDWNPTFFPYGADARTPPTMTTLATTTPCVFLSGTEALRRFGLPSDGRYVVLGLGKYSPIAGVTIEQPPVWQNPMTGYDPDNKYCRFGLVFQTAGAGGTTLTQAAFVGAIALSPFGIVTQDDQLYQQEYNP